MFLFDLKRGSNAKSSVGAPDKVNLVQAWHEEMARGERLREILRRTWCVQRRPGPWRVSLDQLYDARLDHMPVFAVVSQ